MAEVKQVKVDNWGIYFLQRLKHFFNRTDYCDLTLQFQDNAQLKVHRLVLNTCTEYFELLERTCEMYEDCLVMPDDLQADVVVPIVNFMYTGQLEFPMDLLEKLYQTSEIMNMSVLTKLLDSHRVKYSKQQEQPKVRHSYSAVRQQFKAPEIPPLDTPSPDTSSLYKRSYSKALGKNIIYKDKKYSQAKQRSLAVTSKGLVYRPPSPIPLKSNNADYGKKVLLGEPRPTRYELPEELDTDNVFENSFSNISYTSQPLMVHPDTKKQYSKRPRLSSEASTSKQFGNTSTIDILEKSAKNTEENIYEDPLSSRHDDCGLFQQVKIEQPKDTSQLFDQILDQTEDVSKVTIETTKSKKTNTANLDHAKIISEVLKKYPHLVKSNKNIKLKILNTPAKSTPKRQKVDLQPVHEKSHIIKPEIEGHFTYESDVIDSKQAARLIALGAENIEGPWICLICGTPGKALHFTSYYNYRRHLVEVHHEKPVMTLCEYCGQKLTKRNHLIYHLYTKHGVEPPPQYHFPKCNQCNYVALTDALLIKHKISHAESKNTRYFSLTDSLNIKAKQSADGKSFQLQCSACPRLFNTATQLMNHIQNTGHRFNKKQKTSLECVYCMKSFLRESNLYAHLKTQHKGDAIRDGVIDDSDEEGLREEEPVIRHIKCEPQINEYEDVDIQYQIQQRPDGYVHIITKKQNERPEPVVPAKRKILNPGFTIQNEKQKKVTKPTPAVQNDMVNEIRNTNDSHEEIVMIDNNEYILKGNKLIPRKAKQNVAYKPPNIINSKSDESSPASIEYTDVQTPNVAENMQQTNVLLKNSENINEGIPIYVSNDEEYKALLSSNQSIIFDSGNSNKTVTVLSAPHPGSLDTTGIDLDTSQSDENMMIIQDDYNNMNVPESVASENQNIVVVYSDQLNNQSKEYQIITTQGQIQTQFVKSSAIITQNYEKGITTTSAMHTHELSGNVEGVWQDNQVIHQHLEGEGVEISNNSQLQQVQTEQIAINNNNTNIDLSSLQQVEIIPSTSESDQVVQIIPSNGNSDQILEIIPTSVGTDQIVQILPHTSESNQVVQIIPRTESDHVMQILPTTSEPQHTTQIIPGTSDSELVQVLSSEMNNLEDSNVTNSSTLIQSEHLSITVVNENANKIMSEHINLPNSADVSAMSVDSESLADETIASVPPNTISEHKHNQESIVTVTRIVSQHNSQSVEQVANVQSTGSIQQSVNTIGAELESDSAEGAMEVDPKKIQPEDIDIHTAETQQILEEESVDEDAHFITLNPTEQIVDPTEKIQTLTSEWSEEDSETTSQDIPIENAAQEEVVAEDESTVEESLENIQHEVDKHLIEKQEHERNKVAAGTENKENTKTSSNDEAEPENNDINEPAVPVEVKLSSILNDWEDNDSQEEASNEIENEEKIEEEITAEATPNENNLPEPSNDKDDDNIKKLVSDWDDDEEENK